MGFTLLVLGDGLVGEESLQLGKAGEVAAEEVHVGE